MHDLSFIALLLGLYVHAGPLSATYTPVLVKNVTSLGPQNTPDVSHVSRDGGHSVLINGKVVWLYDDTECFNAKGAQLSFVSNTAAISASPRDNITLLRDFGVVNKGKDKDGYSQNAIFADTTVGTGGWVPFQADELEFNQQQSGKERVAIWLGTSPTPISTEQAFLYAPLVYVDYHPQDPSKEYAGRGMTLISITAPSSGGPVATRQGDLIIPGTQIGFGGFSTVIGRKSTDTTHGAMSQFDSDGDRDLYLFGVTYSGLQVARVDINSLATFSSFSFWDPQHQKFAPHPPKPTLIDNKKVYMPGTFSSGSVFYSPYFHTFLMVYFNKKGDSAFYIRYLNLTSPHKDHNLWKVGGRNGKGIEAEDAEALVRYSWSAEQKLYASPPGQGGYNYAGSAHPEFFNRQYFAPSLYATDTAEKDRRNQWYGTSFVSEQGANGQDGKFLLLSWTSQKKGGMDNGIYEIQLAVVEFADIPDDPSMPSTTKPESSGGKTEGYEKVHGAGTAPADPNEAAGLIKDKMKHGAANALPHGSQGLPIVYFALLRVMIGVLVPEFWM